MKKVFLGGTCNGSTWRDDLIKLLNIDYFNPVVDDWTEECRIEEIKQRQECDFCLYTITPKMKGVYSVAEVIDDSNKRPEKTIICLLYSDSGKYWNNPMKSDDSTIRSLIEVSAMVKRNGGIYFDSLEDVANYLNNK